MSRTMKIVIPATILVILALAAVAYYRYKTSPFFAYENRSSQNQACEKKCSQLIREDVQACGDDCLTGVPVYAFDEQSKNCLMVANLESKTEYNYFIKDCASNTFIERWNSPKTSQRDSGSLVGVMERHNDKLESILSDRAQIFLLGW